MFCQSLKCSNSIEVDCLAESVLRILRNRCNTLRFSLYLYSFYRTSLTKSFYKEPFLGAHRFKRFYIAPVFIFFCRVRQTGSLLFSGLTLLKGNKSFSPMKKSSRHCSLAVCNQSKFSTYSTPSSEPLYMLNT